MFDAEHLVLSMFYVLFYTIDKNDIIISNGYLVTSALERDPDLKILIIKLRAFKQTADVNLLL